MSRVTSCFIPLFLSCAVACALHRLLAITNKHSLLSYNSVPSHPIALLLLYVWLALDRHSLALESYLELDRQGFFPSIFVLIPTLK
jgi:hypothetical protein